MADLITGIDWLPNRLEFSGNGSLILPKKYYTSGFVAVLAAFIKSRGLTPDQFGCHHEYNAGYFQAIGLSLAVWGDDDYRMRRRNAGSTYAPLTHLSSRDAVDSATSQINSCLRNFAKDIGYRDSPAFLELLAVVGELHDNVWSHGLNSGFSTAQRRESPGNGWLIEFALADCGMGFLNELRRARIPGIETDAEAIHWCIQEGNSSKLATQEDPWAQSVPDDFSGRSPFGKAVSTFVNTGNHHQGLGLAKLLNLARRYDGTLYLASGSSFLQLVNGVTSLNPLSTPWQGVAISLALKESSLKADASSNDTDMDEIADFMNILRG